MGYPNQDEMIVPLLLAIAELGGRIDFSSEGIEVERALAKHFDLTSEQRDRVDASNNAKGGRAWRNHIQYVRLKAVKRGLVGNGVRGDWDLTAVGYEAVAGEFAFEHAESSDQGSPTSRVGLAVSNGLTTRLPSERDSSLFPEGEAQFVLHRRRERDTTLSGLAKQKRMREAGRLACDVCGFCFSEVYGHLGEGFIEAHHVIPVSRLSGLEKTKLEDLALVCANCHRMLHYRRPWLGLPELRELLAP